MADFLAGSWRKNQPSLDISTASFELVTDLLYHAGTAGLAWWRIHEDELKNTSAGELLHQAYRLQALRTVIKEQRIVSTLRMFREACIDPLLIKGWSIARIYPDTSLRAYGDVDLLVKPAQYTSALRLLEHEKERLWGVDLHKEITELGSCAIDSLFERSHVVLLQDESVRILCPEHELAMLAVHLFKHGAWRPLWLCDVGAYLESLPAAFDWEMCLASSKPRRSWICCAIDLAARLLDANIERVPRVIRERAAPEWLIDSVLKQWGNLLTHDHLPVEPRPLMANSFSDARTFLSEVCARWPDPITATFNLRSNVNSLPRLPYQLSAFVAQAALYLIGH